MDYSVLVTNFKAECPNSDTWPSVQIRSTELVYNQVIVGDWE